jgi:acyl carrier protein
MGIQRKRWCDDLDLIASGGLDSLNVFRLVKFIAETLAARVGDEEISLQNFRTLSVIAAFVVRKKSGWPRAGAARWRGFKARRRSVRRSRASSSSARPSRLRFQVGT